MKTRFMGGDRDLQKTDKTLNSTLTWNTEGILMEAGPRHVDEVRESLRREMAKAEDTPRAASRDEEKNREKGCDQKREGKDATSYRTKAERMNHLSLDRHNIRYANTRARSAMSQP
eukprot:15093701-Heterocapsa_arctica.AAC.1